MWPFRGRARHRLGAAVTGLPSAASGPVATPSPHAAPPPVAAPEPAAVPLSAVDDARSAAEALAGSIEALLSARGLGRRSAPDRLAPAGPEPVATVPPDDRHRNPSPEPVAIPQPADARRHVHLQFRDGSIAELDPESEQARALSALASALTRRP